MAVLVDKIPLDDVRLFLNEYRKLSDDNLDNIVAFIQEMTIEGDPNDSKQAALSGLVNESRRLLLNVIGSLWFERSKNSGCPPKSCYGIDIPIEQSSTLLLEAADMSFQPRDW